MRSRSIALARALLIVALVAARWCPAQEILYELNNLGEPQNPGPSLDIRVASVSDLDGDGCRDLLGYMRFYDTVWEGYLVLSGRTRVPVWSFPLRTGVPPLYTHSDCGDLGDLNGDGQADLGVLLYSGTGLFVPPTILALSPVQPLPLWSVTYPIPSQSYYKLLGGVVTQPHGRPDVIGLVTNGGNPRVDIFDHLGALRYRLQYTIYNGPISLGRIGDIDRDGADDFLVGMTGTVCNGEVQVISGLSGTLIRQHFGPQFCDRLGETVAGVGDMNLDGVPDYAAAGDHTYLAVYSGADGSVLQSWRGPTAGGVDFFARDVDLDGIPDVVSGLPFISNNNNPNWTGRVRAYSGRDGELLWELLSTPGHGSLTHFGQYLADLGVQPESPYPVLVVSDGGYLNYTPICCPQGRLLWVRASLPGGSRQHGAGCASRGDVPTIGFRRKGNGLRLSVAGAEPGALAWLAVGSSRTSHQAVALPLSLDPLGLTGCSLLVSPETVSVRTVDSTGLDRGYAAVDFPGVPAATGGRVFFAQWLVLGNGPAGFYHAATAAQEFRIQ